MTSARAAGVVDVLLLAARSCNGVSLFLLLQGARHLLLAQKGAAHTQACTAILHSSRHQLSCRNEADEAGPPRPQALQERLDEALRLQRKLKHLHALIVSYWTPRRFILRTSLQGDALPHVPICP